MSYKPYEFRIGELIEPLDKINYYLERDYGKAHDRIKYRVVWANDQTELRKVDTTDEGFDLMYPEVREVKKYNNDSFNRYVLERLTEIPEGLETDLPSPLSYEPVWTFSDRHGDYLPPRYDACKFVIDAIEANVHGDNHKPKAKDPMADGNNGQDAEVQELNQMEAALFGSETKASDRLNYASVMDFNPKGKFAYMEASDDSGPVKLEKKETIQ